MDKKQADGLKIIYDYALNLNINENKGTLKLVQIPLKLYIIKERFKNKLFVNEEKIVDNIIYTLQSKEYIKQQTIMDENKYITKKGVDFIENLENNEKSNVSPTVNNFNIGGNAVNSNFATGNNSNIQVDNSSYITVLLNEIDKITDETERAEAKKILYSVKKNPFWSNVLSSTIAGITTALLTK